MNVKVYFSHLESVSPDNMEECRMSGRRDHYSETKRKNILCHFEPLIGTSSKDPSFNPYKKKVLSTHETYKLKFLVYNRMDYNTTLI